MSQEEEKKYPVTIIEPTQDLQPVIEVLGEDDAKSIEVLQEELADNWRKKQIFRTDTEARISVLNDAKHPTPASKYWQSVREMSAHFDGLVSTSFAIKRNAIEKMKLERKLQKAIDKGDDLKEMELRVDLEENIYHAAQMKQTAKDRVRELNMWSKIKSELNDGSFDDQNVNTHQAKSLPLTLQNRVKSLSPHSAPSEVMNAAGPLSTAQRLSTEDGKLLDFRKAKETQLLANQQQEEQKKLDS
jgi:hypothetical protein